MVRTTLTRRGSAVDRIAREVLDRLVRRIIEAYRPARILLFGSHAAGQASKDSDLDLLVVKNTDEPPFARRVTLRRLCRDPQRRIPVDFLVVTPTELEERLAAGDPFLTAIVEQGREVYAA